MKKNYLLIMIIIANMPTAAAKIITSVKLVVTAITWKQGYYWF
jgi:hypothetical protein